MNEAKRDKAKRKKSFSSSQPSLLFIGSSSGGRQRRRKKNTTPPRAPPFPVLEHTLQEEYLIGQQGLGFLKEPIEWAKGEKIFTLLWGVFFPANEILKIPTRNNFHLLCAVPAHLAVGTQRGKRVKFILRSLLPPLAQNCNGGHLPKIGYRRRKKSTVLQPVQSSRG